MRTQHSISSSAIDYMRGSLPSLLDQETLAGPTKLMDINLKDKIMLCFSGLGRDSTVKIYVRSRSLARHLQDLLRAEAIY